MLAMHHYLLTVIKVQTFFLLGRGRPSLDDLDHKVTKEVLQC